jgi:hypothetical protein
MTYESFTKAIAGVLEKARKPLTWTEIRTTARLPQAFPNNKWVRRMESDIGLKRQRDANGIIHWQLGPNADLFGTDATPIKASVSKSKRASKE